MPDRFGPPAAWRAGGAEGWGRLTELRPDRLRLSTQFDWEPGVEGELDFEVPPVRLRGLRVRALRARTGPDGYRELELAVVEPGGAARLRDALMELSRRAPF